MPPNKSSCNVSADYGVIDSFIGASSFHPGGTNVLLMDGSVRFIKDAVNPSVWNALGTRAGGEVLSADGDLTRGGFPAHGLFPWAVPSVTMPCSAPRAGSGPVDDRIASHGADGSRMSHHR